MKILKGKTVSSGIAKGIVALYSSEYEESVPHYGIDDAQVPNEKERLKEAFEKTKSLMSEMIALAKQSSEEQAAEIVNVHLMILNDPNLILKIEQLIIQNKINAEHAINDIFDEYIDLHKKKESHFQELAHDFKDVRDLLLSTITETSGHFECPLNDREPVIVAAQRLNSHMVLNIPRKQIIAFITTEGGYTTHAAVLVRSLGIPMIFGIDVRKELRCGMRAIIDGMTGKVILSPDEAKEKYYDKKDKQYRMRSQFCDTRSHLNAKTKTNVRVTLKVNISNPGEIDLLEGFNHDGIGLLRTEFMFLGRENPPTEDEQYKMYRRILQKAEGKPTVARLLDIGSDKVPLFLDMPEQTNPDLEIRGARAVEYYYEIYHTQAKALLRAALHSEMKILYPMVSDMSDLVTFRSLRKPSFFRLEQVPSPPSYCF